jgi:hypothetical protein
VVASFSSSVGCFRRRKALGLVCVANNNLFLSLRPQHFNIFSVSILIFPFFPSVVSSANRWRASGDFLTASSSANLDVLQAQAALLGLGVVACVGYIAAASSRQRLTEQVATGRLQLVIGPRRD